MKCVLNENFQGKLTDVGIYFKMCQQVRWIDKWGEWEEQ